MNKSRKFLSFAFSLATFVVLQSGSQWATAAEVLLERPYVYSKGDVRVLSNSRTYTLISQKGDFEVWEDNRGQRHIYSTNPLLPRIGWRYLKKDKYVNRNFELDEGEVWKLWPISAGSSAEIKVKFYKEEETDYKGDPKIAGNPTRRDKDKGKQTLINLMGYNKTLSLVKNLKKKITKNIKKYGIKSNDLLQSVEFILDRKF